MSEQQPLNRLADKIHQNSYDHGFWPEEDGERNFGEIIALIHSEASEALEAHRSNGLKNTYDLKMDAYASPMVLSTEASTIVRRLYGNGLLSSAQLYALSSADWRVLAQEGVAKPEGVASELVDVLVRTLDALRGLYPELDIDDKVAEKMAYNATRPAKHGKAY